MFIMDLVKIYFCLCFSCFWFGSIEAMVLKKDSTTEKHNSRNKLETPSTTSNIEKTYDENGTSYISKVRVKRQSGAGKFVEAAEMPQIKLMRLFLQMFKNTWDSEYVGGSHPLHPNVPKVIVQLYKQKIIEFFMPDIGQEHGS